MYDNILQKSSESCPMFCGIYQCREDAIESDSTGDIKLCSRCSMHFFVIPSNMSMLPASNVLIRHPFLAAFHRGHQILINMF